MSSSASALLDKQLHLLAAGFDALQDEYQRLRLYCQNLESNLSLAKAQVSDKILSCYDHAMPSLSPSNPPHIS